MKMKNVCWKKILADIFNIKLFLCHRLNWLCTDLFSDRRQWSIGKKLSKELASRRWCYCLYVVENGCSISTKQLGSVHNRVAFCRLRRTKLVRPWLSHIETECRNLLITSVKEVIFVPQFVSWFVFISVGRISEKLAEDCSWSFKSGRSWRKNSWLDFGV